MSINPLQVLLGESYAQTKSIYALQLTANAAWLHYSVRLFGGWYKRRFACFVWFIPILFIILLLTKVIGYLGVSIVSLVQIVVSLVIIIIKLLCFDSIKINSRLVKFGIILVYLFKLGFYIKICTKVKWFHQLFEIIFSSRTTCLMFH